MSKPEIIVRTIFIAGYFKPGGEMAAQRRETTSPKALVDAMRRVEVADRALEKELSTFTERGYRLVETLRHPVSSKNRYDLLITAIFQRDMTE